MLVGRESELSELSALLDQARAGASCAFVLRGEAGIGKTAMLAEVTAAAHGFRTLHAAGVESEAELPYPVLHQLLRPVHDQIGALPEPQAAALAGALGFATASAERFLVGVATLSLLSMVAEGSPVLAIV